MLEQLAARIVGTVAKHRLRAGLSVQVVPPIDEGDKEFISIMAQGQAVGYFVDYHPTKPGYDLFHGRDLLMTEATPSEVADFFVARFAILGDFSDVTVPDYLPEIL